MKAIEFQGVKWALQDQYLRITHNPKADKYPKTGDIIKIKGHNLIPDGTYVVEIVKEYEPPFNKDDDGRDIRIYCISTRDGVSIKELNGLSIINAMVKE